MSNLLKMSLALENEYLQRRVHAAAILRAQQVQNRDDAQGTFARMILADVAKRWDVFMLAVTANNEIQEALTLAPDNSNVYATDVTDDQIRDIIASALAQNASKYAPQPEGEGS
jgi:hypothetical protein